MWVILSSAIVLGLLTPIVLVLFCFMRKVEKERIDDLREGV